MNSQNNGDTDSVRRALLAHVVAPLGDRPRLDIITANETFYLVTVQEPVFSRDEGNRLAFVFFTAVDSVRRQRTFVWSEDGHADKGLPIVRIQPYLTPTAA